MIDKTKIIDGVTLRLESLPIGHYLDLRTYKRNRSVIIIRRENDRLQVVQNGYERKTYHITGDKLKKLLKMLLKKEFPRSNKIRLYTMGAHSEQSVADTRRKII